MKTWSRRQMLRLIGNGFGSLALTGLLAEQASAASKNPLAAKAPHFPPRANG